MTEIITASAILGLLGVILRWHHGMIQDRVTKHECHTCKEGVSAELVHGAGRFTRVDANLEKVQQTQERQARTLAEVQQLLARVEERVSYLARSNGYKDGG